MRLLPDAVAALLAPFDGPGDLPPPDHSGDAIRRAAREILSRPEFRRPPKSWYQRLSGWLGDLLDRIARVAGGTTIAGVVILLVGLAAIIWLLFRLRRTLRPDPQLRVSVMVDIGRPATDWRREAAAHDAAGEWRQALRCRYRALVADLAAAGKVREVPGRTTGEYRVEVARTLPRAAADFSAATDLFERAWYGASQAGRDENRLFDELSARIATVVAEHRSAVGERSPVGAGARS